MRLLKLLVLSLALGACGEVNVKAVPAGGQFENPVAVEFTITEGYEEAAQIYYTLDGSQPTTESPLYTDSIQIDKSTRLRFFAVLHDNKRTKLFLENYIFTDRPPK